MGTWVELRCEERSEESEGYSLDVGNCCLSSVNAGPMGMADDTRASLIQLIQGLEADARKSGWVKKRAGWVCPFCVRHPAKPNDEKGSQQ